MEFVHCNSNDKAYQRGLNQLLSTVFQDFSFWLDQDLWDQRYESFAIVEDGLFVANICVFHTDILCRGQRRRALSLGAVCTLPAYRGRGYSRALMERILAQYPQTPMYLSANPSVLAFYPRFGFRRVTEMLPALSQCIDNDVSACKLAYGDPRIWAHVRDRVNFSPTLDCANTDTVTMFDIAQGDLADSIYALPEVSALVVGRQQDARLHLAAVFATKPLTWDILLPWLPFRGVERVTFGFMPDALGAPFTLEEEPDQELIFVRGEPWDLAQWKFPELSWT